MEKRSEGRSGSSTGTMPSWDTLEEFIRGHIQSTMQRILDEEVTVFLGRQRSERRGAIDAPAVYRNGHGKPRRISTQGGTVVVRRPRLRGLNESFESKVLPLFVRRTAAVGEMLPKLYLHGLALGDFELALRGLLGEGAPLSASSIERLRASWQLEYEDWAKRDLSGLEIVYAWGDGVYVKAGLEKEKAALLVIIGVDRKGHKHVLTVRPGQRESTESWSEVLRDLRDRGLAPPKVFVADGAAGVWAALGNVWPSVEEQRCWNHKIVNVLDKLPMKQQSEAREILRQIPYAPTRKEAEHLRDKFCKRYERWYEDSAACLKKDWERMVTFYRFPEAHWKHLRTTNVVESPFAAVRLRTDAAKRFKKTKSASVMIWKVLMVAEKSFRRLDGHELLADVHAGKEFIDGKPKVNINQGGRVAA